MEDADIMRIEDMREQGLERKIAGICRRYGGISLKWVSPGFTGVPDRICFLPKGKIVFVEVKAPGRKDGTSPRQKRVAEILTVLGQRVITVNSAEDFEEYINGL